MLVTYTLAQSVAKSEKQIVFEINEKKKRLLARAGKRLKLGQGMWYGRRGACCARANYVCRPKKRTAFRFPAPLLFTFTFSIYRTVSGKRLELLPESWA